MSLPVLNGMVLGNTAWNPIPANDLAGTTSAYFKMVRGLDSAGVDSVMIGIMVFRQPVLSPSSFTQVVLGFVFDESADPPPCAWRIIVQPFSNAPPEMMSLQAASVTYWRNAPLEEDNTTGWNGPTAPSQIAWLSSNTKVWSYNNSEGIWSMAMKLPVNLVNCLGDQSVAFPSPGTPFAFYADVLSTPNGGTGGNYQFPWPAGLDISGAIAENTPPWSEWNDFTL